MAAQYDVAIVGAGHNGLVAANYLARAGKRVIVLEARDVVGGACVTEELIPGSRWSSCAFIAGLLRPEVISELELPRFGLEMYQGDVLSYSLFRDGSHMFFWKEIDRTLREIERHSPRDAQRFLDFGLRLRRFADIATPWLLQSPPTRSEVLRRFEEEGEEELFNEFVLLSTRDLLDRYFESEHLKGMLTFFGMVSVWGGPSTPGTAYTWGHHSWGEFNGHFGQFGFVRGGMGGISEALANGARHHGAEIRVGAPVARVLVEGGAARGVALESGEEIAAATVVSNADPKRSLLRLVEPSQLDDDFRTAVEAIDQRGSMARIHLLIDELPHVHRPGARRGAAAPRPPAARGVGRELRGGLGGPAPGRAAGVDRDRGGDPVDHRSDARARGPAHDDARGPAAPLRPGRRDLGRRQGEVGRLASSRSCASTPRT